MRLAEFNALVEKAVQEDRYVEAFLLKSLYIESVITVLATAIKYKEKGFDGDKLSVATAVEKDPEEKKFFQSSVEDRLSENIKVLRRLPVLKEKQVDYLYTWKDKYRDNIFHNFGALMMDGDVLERKAKEGFEFIKKFTDEEWFKGMEESFRKSEEKILKSRLVSNSSE